MPQHDDQYQAGAELAERISEVRRALDKARGQTVQSPTFSYLYDQTGRICDTSTALDAEAVPYLASQLRRILEGALQNSFRFSDHDAFRFARTLRDLESELPATPSADTTSDRSVGEERLLCFVTDRPAVLNELHAQLKYYGMPVASTALDGQLERAIAESSTTLGIVDAGYIDRHPRVQHDLKALRKRHASRFRIVVVSEEDSFAARISGVRSGGDAFSTLPVDLAPFMTLIDSLTLDGNVDPYHVLIVDDSPEEVAEMALILQRAGMVTSVVTEPQQVFQVLIERKPDLIVLSAELVGCTGPELAAVIRQQEAFMAVPMLFVANQDDRQHTLESIRVGGDEVVTKPFDADVFVRSVSIRLQRARDTRYLMERDSLTGLLNHSNLKESLATEILRAQRIGTSVSFAMLDIDKFKNVNDTYGHLMGDRILRSLSRLLQERLRKTDTVGRYGGEEFGVVFFNTDVLDAASTMNRIRDAFSQMTHQLSDAQFSVSFSGGVASFPNYRTAAAVIAAADRALYAAKQGGRNRIVSG